MSGSILTVSLAWLVIMVAALLLAALLFAATTVWLRLRNRRRAQWFGAMEEEWTPRLLAALDGSAAGTNPFAGLSPRQRLFLVDLLLRTANRLRGAELEAVKELAAPLLADVEPRVRDSDPADRSRAVRTLGVLGMERYRLQLLAALEDPAPLVALHAMKGLAVPGNQGDLPALLGTLHRFEGWSANYLSSTLARVGVEGAPTLRNALEDASLTPWVRRIAALSLVRLDDATAADVAARVLERPGPRELVVSTLGILAETGRPEHLPVIRFRTETPDFMVRAAALRTLGRIGGEDELPLLLEAMNDPSPWVALHAARGVHGAGGGARLAELAGRHDPRSRLAEQVLLEAGRP